MISLPISNPSSLIFLCLTNCRCFLCRSRAASRTRSRLAASSGLRTSPVKSEGVGGGGCWSSAWGYPTRLRLAAAALRSRCRFRRWRSAAFSRLCLSLVVSVSRERFRGEPGVVGTGLWVLSVCVVGSICSTSLFRSVTQLPNACG
jgi:hypothetical protein